MGITPAIIGAAASVGSLGLAASGALSGPSSGPGGGTGTNVFTPPGQPQIGSSLLSLINQQQDVSDTLPQQQLPQLERLSGNIVNNKFDSGQMAGAMASAATAGQNAQTDLGLQAQLLGAGNQVYQQAFDPQQALYNQTQNQLSQQINAQNAMSGLGSSPYGASVADNSLGNFNINWQNNQLGRMESGAQTVQGLDQAGAGFGTAAQQNQLLAGSLPYQTYLSQQQDALGGLQDLSTGISSSFAPEQLSMNNMQSFLGLGQTASSNAIAAQQAAFNQQLQLGKAAGSALNSLGNLSGTLGGTLGGNSGSMPSTADQGQVASVLDPGSFSDPSGGGFGGDLSNFMD